MFDLFHEDQVVQFENRDLYLWLPSGEHLFVAFGDKRLLCGLGDPQEAAAAFDDYRGKTYSNTRQQAADSTDSTARRSNAVVGIKFFLYMSKMPVSPSGVNAFCAHAP
ncbi:MAG: hypothetical protein Q4G28_07505 [Neisseria sp.]|nr:hypothetical protein [Neisseria sp.]